MSDAPASNAPANSVPANHASTPHAPVSDLRTRYLGLHLKNPFVPSSSPLTGDFDSVRRLEDAGAAAIVLPSLFEESLQNEEHSMTRFLDHQDIGHPEATSFLPEMNGYLSELDQHVARIERYKQALSIPVIGSLNGITPQGWIRHAQDLQDAGCDALELNLYGIASRREESAVEVEQRYLFLVQKLLDTVSIPVAVKLSHQFSSPIHFIGELEQLGVQGVSVFNRFYQPDIDLASRHIVPRIQLSHSYESLLRIRWIAMLRNQVELGIAATGGFHTIDDALKGLMVGADVIHLCSVLLQNGPSALADLLRDLRRWLATNEYASVQQLKGCLSYRNAINPAAFERANYAELIGHDAWLKVDLTRHRE